MSKRCCAKSCYNSQMKNRMVHYFGFPKNTDYARKWAIAAGREDLLEKPIQNVIKYFLCSSHFTDDCFQDPPLNSKLKKTHRPVTVPIPTIFVSNIDQYMPRDEESIGYDTQQIGNEITPKKISLLKRSHIEKPIKEESVCENSSSPDMIPIYLEEYELPAKKIRDTEFTLLVEPTHELEEHLDEDESSSSDDFHHISNNFDTKFTNDQNSTKIENVLDENGEFDEFTCRLCGNDFTEQQLLFFQDDEDLIDIINSVLPRSVIQPDDYLPQQICIGCLEKVYQCREILNDFEVTQERLVVES